MNRVKADNTATEQVTDVHQGLVISKILPSNNGKWV